VPSWVIQHSGRCLLLQITDFNSADAAIAKDHADSWGELKQVLEALPLYLKSSDQAGIQGMPIFDPVGTNEHIKAELKRFGWSAAIPIPEEYSFLGTDVDFGKLGLLVEVQFSNYPFLLNNTIRSELFYKAGLELGGHKTTAAVIIAKAQMFPASNSTLYYEQAVKQLVALAKNKVFDAPIRMVGLFERTETEIEVCFTDYGARYSRTVGARVNRLCLINPGGRTRSRLQFT
jgi:hypothetical protein